MRMHHERSPGQLVLGLLSLFVLPALVTACGGGGGGGGSSGDGQAAILLSSAPASEDLCSLSVVVTDVTLVDDSGRETQNLLAGPTEVDLLALTGQNALLALAPVPSGTYVEARAAIDPQSVQARDVYGNPVEVPVAQSSASGPCTPPVVVGGRVVPIGIEVPILDCFA